MNIDKIKSNIKLLMNKNVMIKVNNGRNKYEYYEGKINKMYPNIFSVLVNEKTKTFSYSDVLIKNVIIKLM